MMFKTQILLIEGGRPLEMVRQHYAEAARVREQNNQIALELGVDEIWTSKENGHITGVLFKGDIPPDFTKPKSRGRPSYPKRGSAWEKRFNDLVGFRSPEQWIHSEFNIPLTISYSRNGKWCGCTHIGIPMTACGFLYLSENGPFAMWAPDVPYYVSTADSDRGDIDELAKSFKFDIPGTRLISEDEWNLIVLQDKIAKQKEAV